VNGASKISGIQRKPTDNSDQIGRGGDNKSNRDCRAISEKRRKKEGNKLA
jgi:hypothetical protein